MANTQITLASFLRITSISVSAYDYLVTIPAEWRLYRAQGPMRFGKISFVLIRYFSIVLLTVSNVGYFYDGFSAATCSAYHIVSPILKVIQIMISQVIIGCRAWAITGRSKELGLFLLGFGVITTALEWYTNLDGRTPLQNEGNCSPGTAATQWAFYLLAVLFDAATCVISTFFLVRSTGGIKSMSALTKVLFYDGLGYMLILTSVNVLNLILYGNIVQATTQSSAASFGYMVTWIMSQRLLIHIHETAGKHIHRTTPVPRQIPAPRDITNPMRNQFNSSTKDGTGTEIGEPGVQVRIERAVTVDYPIVLDITAENRGLSGNGDGVLPKGLGGHPGNKTGGNLRGDEFC